MNTIEFIEKAKQVHGDKYDYSKAEYVNYKTPIKIICPEHGEFEQISTVHLRGSGCKKCGLERIKKAASNTTESFIKNAKEKHGNKYDYSKVDYKGENESVCITCPTHGDFFQLPISHLRGSGCPGCLKEKLGQTKETFIQKARAVHGDKYDYSKVEYTNVYTKVCIICHEKDENGVEHGEFWQLPLNHLKWGGCKKCKKKTIGNLKRKTKENFIEEANKVHKNKYSYDKLIYNRGDELSIITCPIHGGFKQRPGDHLRGHGCPKCANQQSIAEDEIYNYLSKMMPNEPIERRNNGILSNKMEIDLYMPSKKIGIEYNGLHWHTEEYNKNNLYHVNKTNKCNELGIGLIHVFEDEYTYKKEAVISRICHVLNIRNDKKIDARKCKISEINNNDAEEFTIKNGIENFVSSKIHIGAFFNGEIVAILSLNEMDKNHWLITNLVSNYKFICRGVCGKLLSYFKRKYTWNTIKAFADRRWTINENESVYAKMGFVFDGTTEPDYEYVIDKKRVDKATCKKDEKTLENKKIWDCGKFKYILFNGDIY